MQNPTSAVHLYGTLALAEAAVKSLHRAGLEISKLSIVGHDPKSEKHVIFWVPGVGPSLLAGPMVASLIVAIEGASVDLGLSAVGAGLQSMGIAHECISEYEKNIAAGQYVLIFHGEVREVVRASTVLDDKNDLAAKRPSRLPAAQI